MVVNKYYMGQEDARRVSKDLADGSSDWEKQGMMKKRPRVFGISKPGVHSVGSICDPCKTGIA